MQSYRCRGIAATLAIAMLVPAPAMALAKVTARTAAQRPNACGHIDVGRRHASRIRTNLRCPRARRLVRRWLHARRLPHQEFGWYCSGRRSVTCGGGNGGNAPYVRFRYRR